jgi:hypothetical protein
MARFVFIPESSTRARRPRQPRWSLGGGEEASQVQLHFNWRSRCSRPNGFAVSGGKLIVASYGGTIGAHATSAALTEIGRSRCSTDPGCRDPTRQRVTPSGSPRCSVLFYNSPQLIGHSFSRDIAIDGNGQKDSRVDVIGNHGPESWSATAVAEPDDFLIIFV